MTAGVGSQHGVEVGSSYAAATPQGVTHAGPNGLAPVAQPPPGQSSQLANFGSAGAEDLVDLHATKDMQSGSLVAMWSTYIEKTL